jgi:alkylation response protein AidB-like acyl-CoA dehydrogenase
MSEFFQDGPRLENTYLSNRWLQRYLRRRLPADLFADVDEDLKRFGRACAGPLLELARTAEREKPTLVPFDPWGRRIDQLRLSPAWTELQKVSARENLIGIAYRRNHGEFSRSHQFAKLLLFHPSSAFFTCPLAMADGAARVLELNASTPAQREAFDRLTSNDPGRFWTSGQWMTERTGGSDVSRTSTDARLEDGQVRLYGTKWFSSSTASEMALALARTPGGKSLSLYFVKTFSAPGVLNNIEIMRLKDKLGTWALPTAELSLRGTLAEPLGPSDQGVKTVATMLNITRLYNSVCSVGQSARALELMRDYSSRRETFGRSLEDHVLHAGAFVEQEMKALAGFLLTFELVHLLGKEECGRGTPEESAILRLMTPVCKLFTARSAIQIASEVVEGFGGAGYIEDTGIPVHLRDSQVFPIWEGATNVLSLDMLRAIQKSSALEALFSDMERRIGTAPKSASAVLKKALNDLRSNLAAWKTLEPETQTAATRSLAFYLGRLYGTVLLAEWAGGDAALEPWLQFALNGFLGEWRPTEAAEVSLVKKLWSESPAP